MEDLILTGNKYGTAGHSRAYVFANKESTVMYGINDGKGHQVLLTDEVYIQPEKNIWLDVTVFAEITENSIARGYGCYVQINAKINDTWYDLGNSGIGQLIKYDALPEVPRHSIRRYVDFDTVPDDLSAGGVSTVQIEVVLYSTDALQRIMLNPHTGVNPANKSSGSGASGTALKEAQEQNYTNVTITEISK